MELSSIEKLLEKYLNAETSLREEAVLKSYFLSENVASHLEEYKEMFSYFECSKTEILEKPIQLGTKKTNWKWLSVVASVVLLLSVYVGDNYLENRKAKEQYAQIKDALQLLSVNLNKGSEAMTSLYVYEDTVNKIFKIK